LRLKVLSFRVSFASSLMHRYNCPKEETHRMTTADIVASIDAEIEKLQNARSALTGGSVSSGSAKKAASAPKTRKKRVLSAEARAKIAAAQKKRWAKQKAAKKS
jgi:hypothetical protein